MKRQKLLNAVKYKSVSCLVILLILHIIIDNIIIIDNFYGPTST